MTIGIDVSNLLHRGIDMRNLLQRARRSVRKRFAPDECVCNLNDGSKVQLYPRRDAHELFLYSQLEYEPGTLFLFDQVLRPGDTFVDVGANLGLMTLHAARLVGSGGKVISFEPHPTYFKRLQDHITMNRFQNVQAINMAAGSRDGVQTIYDFPDVSIGRSSLIDAPDGKAVAEVKVEKLDSALARLGVNKLRLIKIDVEGFENEVLLGAEDTLRLKPIICMEVETSLPTNGIDPYSAHDIIMRTGTYSAYRFVHSKHQVSKLSVLSDAAVSEIIHDNVVYMPNDIASSLPDGLCT